MYFANKAIVLLLVMLLTTVMPSLASADENETCKEAANKISEVIVDWHQMVKDVGAEAKNPSVLKMYSDHVNKRLKLNFVSKCLKNWNTHQDVYSCFSGVRSEIGAAMCMHPDTNKSNWSY